MTNISEYKVVLEVVFYNLLTIILFYTASVIFNELDARFRKELPLLIAFNFFVGSHILGGLPFFSAYITYALLKTNQSIKARILSGMTSFVLMFMIIHYFLRDTIKTGLWFN